MSRIPNPYVVGAPIAGDAHFYGRFRLISFVRDTLNPPQQRVVVLYGQRRIGKTSVLYELARRLSDDYHPVYFDLMGQANRPLTLALHEIAGAVADSLFIDPPPRFEDPLQFRRFLAEAQQQTPAGKPLMLLLDEFDDLSDQEVRGDAAALNLFDYLRELLNAQMPVAFVFVVGRRLTELPQNFQSILKQAPSRRVAYLPKEDTGDLIVEPARGHLAYTPEAIDAIYNLTSGHPYFTQLICFELFRLSLGRGDKTITAVDVTSVLDKAMETGKGGLAWFWDALPLAERFVMAAIAEVSGPDNVASLEEVRQCLTAYDLSFLGMEVTDAPNLLVQWEILRDVGDGYQFAVDLVRRWILAEHPLGQAKREVENLSPRANRYFANAREAHQAGELDLAVDDYRRALSANPLHYRAQLGLAQALEEQGDLLAAQQEYRKAYNLDQESARDSLCLAYEKLADVEEQRGNLEEAILKLEKAQALNYLERRQSHVEELQALVAEKRARRSRRWQQFGFLAGGLVLLAAAAFVLTQLGIFTTSTTDIPAATAGETLILIAPFAGAEELGLSPEAHLEAAWREAFPDIRFERLPTVVDDEETAVRLARSVSAVGVLGIGSWIANDSLGTSIEIVATDDAVTVPFDLNNEFGEPRASDLTAQDLEAYATLTVDQARAFELDQVAHALSGKDATASGANRLARLILQLIQFRSDVAADYVSWADSIVRKDLDHYEPIIIDAGIHSTVAFVPFGNFTMGRDAAEMLALCQEYSNACNPDLMDNNPPQIEQVRPFFIDVYEVSNGAYRDCINDDACSHPAATHSRSRDDYFDNPDFSAYPVINVSWGQAQEFCQWRYGRLPYEVEWEKAARWDPATGETFDYPWGNEPPTADRANYLLQPGDTVPALDFPNAVSPVGAHQMAGNVWEWTQSGAPGEETAEPVYIIRGGGYGDAFGSGEIPIVDPAFRGEHDPGPNEVTGFRCAYDNPFGS